MSTTRDEARRMAEVMLAFADGAQVQSREWLTNTWFDVNPESSGWDSARYDYRIKTKPRKAWVIYADDGRVFTACNTRDDAAPLAARLGGTVVHTREAAA